MMITTRRVDRQRNKYAVLLECFPLFGKGRPNVSLFLQEEVVAPGKCCIARDRYSH